MKPIGTRIQVYSGVAKETSGGLTKNKLAKNKHGKIVSKKKQGQRSNLSKYLTNIYRGGPAPKPKPKAKPAPPAPKPKPKAKPAPPPKPKAKPKPKPAPAPTRRSTRVRKKTKRFGF